ncbi:MAG: hypothetical protein ABIZ49_03350, partial [Opitutaceae bacterium]
MSLINEALKKAQRQRNEGPADLTTPAPAGGRIAKHGQARSAQSMILIACGAVALVVASVGLTIFLLNRPAQKPPPAVASANVNPPKIDGTPATPTILLPPPVTPPLIQTDPASTPPVATTNPGPTPIIPAPSEPAPTPVAVGTKPPAKPAPPAVDERVQAYVDGLRINGAKPAGPEIRVLMNDRFYRINDIVDRTLGVKLIKVDSNTLTFADAN